MERKHIPQAVRQAVAERAGRCCEYCRSQERYSVHSFSIDHVVPISRGGATVPSNLAFACPGCNGHKHTKTTASDPVTLVTVGLFDPRTQAWGDHFAWNDDYSLIIGLSAVGRATVEALDLNRATLVNLRQALHELRLHP